MPRPVIVDAFVDAVVRVMKSMGEEARLVATRYSSDVDPPPSIVVTIELRGSLNGPVTWSFSRDLARHITQQMLLGAASEEYYPAAAAELANIMLGNATGALEEAGYLVELAPPSLRTERREGPQVLVADVVTDSGEMKLLFDVEEAA